jgi:hypothetical protein
MKKKNTDISKKGIVSTDQKKISRKQAIKKAGLVALSATTMMMLLSTNAQAQASLPGGGSPPPDPSPGWN